MNNMFRIFMVILISGYYTYNTAIAKNRSGQTKLEDRYFLRSEDIGDEPGLYTLKKLEGSETQAVVIAWQDMVQQKKMTLKEMRKYKYYVYSTKEYYNIEIRGKQPDTLMTDGWEIYTYKIDAKDFSIISKTKSCC